MTVTPDLASLTLSPSQIESFDHNAPFGCQRKWWYRNIGRVPDKSSPGAQLGTEVHGIIERYILKEAGKDASSAAKAIFGAMIGMVDKWAPDIDRIEMKTFTHISGLKLVCKIDATLKGGKGVLDWKTTSNLSTKYKGYKKAGGPYLKQDTQMIVYALVYFEFLEAMGQKAGEILLVHCAAQTKTDAKNSYPTFEVVEKITREEVDRYVSAIIVPLIEEMKVVSQVTTAEKVKGDSRKCFMCSYNNRCSIANPGETTMTSAKEMLAMYKKNNTTPVVTKVTPEVPVSTQADVQLYTLSEPMAPEPRHPQQVLPPDAPKSDPKINAAHVPGFQDPRLMKGTEEAQVVEPTITAPSNRAVAGLVEAPPPKMGTTYLEPKAETPAEPVKAKRTYTKKAVAGGTSTVPVEGHRISKVTISHGLTLNLGKFNSARVDVGLEAEVNGDFDSAFEALTEQVRMKLLVEIDKYEQLKGKEE